MDDPTGVAVDAAGNTYVSDAGRHVIWKIAPNGTASAFAGTTVHGFAGDNGPAAQALINGPYGMVFDAAGNMYFADFGNHRVRKIGANGVIVTVAGTGTGGSTGDGGPAASARLNRPIALAFDSTGRLHICENLGTCHSSDRDRWHHLHGCGHGYGRLQRR
jgi:DNA-binding beta-propeller fold protein YncE